jgi:hypothetical protein
MFKQVCYGRIRMEEIEYLDNPESVTLIADDTSAM